MSAPALLIARFRSLLDSGEIDRSGLPPADARELVAIAQAQDRVIRHMAACLPSRGKDRPVLMGKARRRIARCGDLEALKR